MTTPNSKQSIGREAHSGALSQSSYVGDASTDPKARRTALGGQQEHENGGRLFRIVNGAVNAVRRHSGKVFGLALACLIGAAFASGPDSKAVNLQLRDRLRRFDTKLKAREGELALTRIELARMTQIIDNSRRYKIPADLAESIYDVAVSEGVDPKIAFSLVRVESEFYHRAVSPKGAVGLTQVMPATARMLDPGVAYAQLFDHETNLRLGFRYLRDMIAYYNGDVGLALTAYNRGPGTVDKVRRHGGDPSNGYSDAVINGKR